MSWFIDYCKVAERSDQLTHKSNHVELLACGLFGEAGSLLSELKKERRESEAYPSYRNRLTEELGDLLWYLARMLKLLAPDDLPNELTITKLKAKHRDNVLAVAFSLGSAAGGVLDDVYREPLNPPVEKLRAIWNDLLQIVRLLGIDIEEVAHKNIEKIQNRWPDKRNFVSFFDDEFGEEEQLPRNLIVEFRNTNIGNKEMILLRCNGLNFGDRLTDNIDDADFYRFHDIFHFAYVVFLGWSPVTRHLLRCKRKSDAKIDENQDGARARIVEEAISAIVFSRAKEMNYYKDIDTIDYDLLKIIQRIVSGYEVANVPLWQWEIAILQGYRVFRLLQRNNGGTVCFDMLSRDFSYMEPT